MKLRKKLQPWKPIQRARRLGRGIVRRGSTEPTIALLLINLLASGLTLCAAEGTPVLNDPRPFGAAYLALFLVGLYGLLGRKPGVRAAFGFCGLFLRLWMTARFLLNDWQNPIWVSFAVSALAYGWIAARCACRHIWIVTVQSDLKAE